MTRQQAPRRRFAERLLGATALLLCAWVQPSIAAAGADASCDEALEPLPMSLSGDRGLAMQVIDHGAPSAGTPRNATDQPQQQPVDAVLRDMLDDAQARPQAEQDDAFSAPLAVEKSEPLDDSPGALEADSAETTAEVPGFRGEEMLRYRHQMYRRDI